MVQPFIVTKHFKFLTGFEPVVFHTIKPEKLLSLIFVLSPQSHKERLVKLNISVRIFHIMINLVKVSYNINALLWLTLMMSQF